MEWEQELWYSKLSIRERRFMRTEFARNLDLAQAKIQYDEQCKKVLGNKHILSWILQRTVKEYVGMSREEIMGCIEGEPEIGSRRVNPGETNAARISGLTNEDKVNEEGEIYYDIRFFAWVLGKKKKIRLIINIEAQKAYYVGYSLTTRGIFYGARMISAQLGTEFEISKYNDLKKVYSIWICMNAPQYIGNAISEYKIEKEDLIPGIPEKRAEYDKLSVVMVCLNTKKGTDDQFLQMMNVLFDSEMPEKEKKERLEKQYEIKMENELGEELSLMCNLSDVVEEKAREKGLEQGIEQGREQGKLEMLFSLVRDHILNTRDAAARAKMSEKKFIQLMEQK